MNIVEMVLNEEDRMLVRSIAGILKTSELQVVKTPHTQLIKKLVGAYVDLQFENARIEKEKIKSDITIKAIEDFIEVYKK